MRLEEDEGAEKVSVRAEDVRSSLLDGDNDNHNPRHFSTIYPLFLECFSHLSHVLFRIRAGDITISFISQLISPFLMPGSNQSLIYLFTGWFSSRCIGYAHILSVSNVHFQCASDGPNRCLCNLLSCLSVGGCRLICPLVGRILVMGLSHRAMKMVE